MIDVQELTIAQAQNGFRTGQFTAKDLCSLFLERISSLDKDGPKINSTMALSSTVLGEASELDDYFQKTGQFKGKLHGIPVLVKDQADTKGMVTTYGSSVARSNIPKRDATVITKLKESGALILGKTTMAEWAVTWFSASSATDYEFTRNPYNLSHDVGASSGGSGAAVAANFAILAVGEDTGGSIRVPSSFCNIVGLRTTPGLISRAGFCPLVAPHDTPGPMARTVTDCALMLDCMVGFDPLDEFTGYAATAAALGLPRGGSYTSTLESGHQKIRKAKIGVMRQLFGADSDSHCKAVNDVIANAMHKLEQAGTSFVDVYVEKLDHYMTYPQTYLQRSRSDINRFLATKPHLPQDIAEIIPKVPEKSYLGMLCAVAHGPEDPLTDATFAGRLLERDAFKRKIDCLIASMDLDAILFPDVQIPPLAIDDAATERLMINGEENFPTNTFLASITRLPAISVPAGFTRDGLPIGLELVGLEHQEQKLLELAYGVEAIVGARRPP
ncbi:amidase signature enzyme, partial [Thozetella sp. PMI_491]